MEITQRIYCVSHETPLIPAHLFDYAIGLGDYHPACGAHISVLAPFWDRMRPIAYGAAGNYAIPRAIELATTRTALTGVFSHRKVVLRSSLGIPAIKFPAYSEISVESANGVAANEIRPNEGREFLVGQPLKFPQGIIRQYAEKHHLLDLLDYLSLAVSVGVITSSEVSAVCFDTVFIPGGCELGVYPTDWLMSSLTKLERLAREFLAHSGERIRNYDPYQVRAVGFLAERLGSYLLLRELRCRFPQGLPNNLFGHLCVVVTSGHYSGAVA